MQEGAQDPIVLPEGGSTPSPAVREAKPEDRVAPQSLQRGDSRGAPRGTGDSERTPAGTGQDDAEEDIQQDSPEPRIAAQQVNQPIQGAEPATAAPAQTVRQAP